MIEQPNKCLKIIRALNLVTGFVIIGFGLAGLLFMAISSILSGKIFLIFSPIFMMLFGILLLAAECKISILLKKFGFLTSLLGRGIFNIYLASEVFFYFSCGSNSDVLGWVFGLVLWIMGLLYVFLHFCEGNQYTRSIKKSIE